MSEMNGTAGVLRAPFASVKRWLAATPPESFAHKRQEADLMFQRIGITFNVYGQSAGAERLIPFDLIPRVLSAAEWKRLSVGLTQRVKALNLKGIYFQKEFKRFYPNDALAAQVLGYVGTDDNGLGGLERLQWRVPSGGSGDVSPRQRCLEARSLGDFCQAQRARVQRSSPSTCVRHSHSQTIAVRVAGSAK